MNLKPITSLRQAHANRRLYKADTQYALYSLLQTAEARSSMPRSPQPLTLSNAKAKPRELEHIAQLLGNSHSTELPRHVKDTLLYAIRRRQLKAVWFSSQTSSCAVKNATHQCYTKALVKVHESITSSRRKTEGSPALLSPPSGAFEPRKYLRGNYFTASSLSKDKSSILPNNRYILLDKARLGERAVSTLTPTTVDTQRTKLRTSETSGVAHIPSNRALRDTLINHLLDTWDDVWELFEGGLSVTCYFDEMAMGTNQAMRDMRALCAKLSSAVPTIRTGADLSMLQEFYIYLPGPDHELKVLRRSRKLDKREANKRLLDMARQIADRSPVPGPPNNESLSGYLELNIVYVAALEAIRTGLTSPWFLLAWRPYMQVQTLLESSSKEFLETRLEVMSKIEQSLIARAGSYFGIIDPLLQEGNFEALARRMLKALVRQPNEVEKVLHGLAALSCVQGIVTARQFRLNLEALSGHALKHPFAAAIYSFSAMLALHKAIEMQYVHPIFANALNGLEHRVGGVSKKARLATFACYRSRAETVFIKGSSALGKTERGKKLQQIKRPEVEELLCGDLESAVSIESSCDRPLSQDRLAVFILDHHKLCLAVAGSCPA